MSNFRRINRTGFLLPPSVEEWLPQGRLARFVVDVTPCVTIVVVTVPGRMLVSLARLALKTDASARQSMKSLGDIRTTLVRTATDKPAALRSCSRLNLRRNGVVP